MRLAIQLLQLQAIMKSNAVVGSCHSYFLYIYFYIKNILISKQMRTLFYIIPKSFP